MNIEIKNIEYYLPVNVETNEILKNENSEWDIDKIYSKTGIKQRHVVSRGETAFSLACKAVEKLFQSGFKLDNIDGIIFCTQSNDYVMPSNSFLLHEEFNFSSNVWTFDYNLACSGFVYGLSISKGMILSGMADNILLVTGDTYSHYVNKRDRSTRFLFGDGAAATIIGKSTPESTSKILDIELSTSGREHKAFYIPHGGSRNPKSKQSIHTEVDHSGNVRSKCDIHMNGFAVWKFISNVVPKQIKRILVKNDIEIQNVDKFLFHQASKLTLDSLAKVLSIDESKVPRNLDYIGNTVSASLPILIKDCLNKKALKKNDLVIISGFGVGLSWGTALIRF